MYTQSFNAFRYLAHYDAATGNPRLFGIMLAKVGAIYQCALEN